MKTKISQKPRLRSKAAKIAYLKRSAAGKMHHHRRLTKRQAKIHLLITSIGVLFFVSAGVALAAQVENMIPPPGNEAQVDAYIRAVQAQSQAKRSHQAQSDNPPPSQIGAASWYAWGLANPDALTCASRTFPRGTYLRVHDIRTGREVICLVDDYGPAAGTNRVLDLSRGSYEAMDSLGTGTMPVEIWITAGPQ